MNVNFYGEATDPDTMMNVRRWPDDSKKSNPFWWELYQRDKLVIYGHDSLRGLKDNRPYTLGLDNGCVYNGVLAGYILEQDRLVTVGPIREGP